MNAVEGSLRRLGTDHIDLYFIHHVDIQTPLEEMLRAFDDLIRQGKVRYTACSNPAADGSGDGGPARSGGEHAG
jgi:aryl-alcohol dehydrogenase-like predicted oxidoreductase